MEPRVRRGRCQRALRSLPPHALRDRQSSRTSRSLSSALRPTVLATAILWHSRGDAIQDRRSDLDAWADALAGSAQTAFEHRQYGRYLLLVAEEPRGALDSFNKSSTLDATSWQTYALAGRALAELDRPKDAIRAYQTAIALTAHESSGLRRQLKEVVVELRAAEP